MTGGLGTAWRRFRWGTELFRFLPLPEADPAQSANAIRWVPPVRIGGEALHALRVPGGVAITYHVRTRPGARILVECAIAAEHGDEHQGALEFDLHVEVPDLGWQQRDRLVLRSARRRWRRLTVRLPPGPARQAVVRLSTRPAGDGASSAGTPSEGVWGEPRMEWPRSRADRWRSVIGLVARVRRGGLLSTMRYARALPAFDEQASRYRRWMAVNTPAPEALAAMTAQVDSLPLRPLISVITPVYNTDHRWLRACIESVRRQAYPHWELCLANDGSTSEATLRVLREYEGDPRIRLVHLDRNSGISAASNAALAVATGEFLALLDHDDELAPEALFEVVRLLNRVPDADFIYSDEDKLDSGGERCDSSFKPDWSPEHFRSTMYTCHLMVLRTSLVRDLGGVRTGLEGAQDYDLALRVIERSSRIEHIPRILYHWRKIEESAASSSLAKPWAIEAGRKALEDHVERSGLDAVVQPGPLPGLYRVRHRIDDAPLVSIVIPTMGGEPDESPSAGALMACLRSVIQKSTYRNIEIVIAEDSPLPAATVELLQSVRHSRVRYDATGTFNYARKVNFAIAHSHGSHLVLFNDDIEVIAPDWIEAMLEFSQQDAIGAVGARLVFPDGRLQHIGVLLGVCGLAAHAFHGYPGATEGYGASALIVRNYSAVTGACMMTRREVYERMRGFDERFACDFNDTDYCLRIRREGLRVVYTPYAELLHRESASFGTRVWNGTDLERMRRTWGDVCASDPYYNSNLTRDFPDYRVRT